MHVLDRRSAARRASDQGFARAPQDPAVSNRRRTDRRVSASRKRMSGEQLDAIQAGSPAGMTVKRVTFVVNGPCFAWLAEIDHRRACRFLAGAGLLAQDAVADDALAAVMLGVWAKLREWT